MRVPRQDAIEAQLSRTGWARGVQVVPNNRERRIIAATRPATRAQLRAGARKIIDQINSAERRQARKAI